MSINNGLPGLPINSEINHFEIQSSDVAQLEAEKRLFEDGLLIDGVGLIDVQFFPPSIENLFGGKNSSLANKLNLKKEKTP